MTESNYNPRFSMRHAMLEKHVLFPRLRKNYHHDDLSHEDTKAAKRINVDQLVGIVKKHGIKGSKRYSEDKLKQFRLFSKSRIRKRSRVSTRRKSGSRKRSKVSTRRKRGSRKTRVSTVQM